MTRIDQNTLDAVAALVAFETSIGYERVAEFPADDTASEPRTAVSGKAGNGWAGRLGTRVRAAGAAARPRALLARFRRPHVEAVQPAPAAAPSTPEGSPVVDLRLDEIITTYSADMPADGDPTSEHSMAPASRRRARRTLASPAEALAGAALRHALPAELIAQIRRGGSTVVMITVPDAAWVKPVARAAKRLHPDVEVFDKGSMPRPSEMEELSTRAADHIAQGDIVVGVAPPPGTMLPEVLRAAAAVRVEIRGVDSAMLGYALRRCSRGRVPDVPEGTGKGLSFLDLVACVRKGETATQAVDRMVAATQARSTSASVRNAPRLEDLHGYGEARQWAIELTRAVGEWAAGKRTWDSFSSSAVVEGPPGTGKTLLAEALAQAMGARLVATSVGKWFSSSPGHLDGVIKEAERVFDDARNRTPSVLFIDEIDGLPNRAGMGPREASWWSPVVGHILTLLDGAQSPRDGVVLLSATNHVEKLDRALIRPGRFDRVLSIQPPDAPARAAILRLHLGTDLPDVDLDPLAETIDGMTGAAIAGLVRTARGRAGAAGRDLLPEDLLAAIVPPDGRPGWLRRRMAVHEAGHAVAALAVGADVGLVSIVQDGPAGGRTLIEGLRLADSTLEELENQVVVSLAGRAADVVAGDGASAGSAASGTMSDLARATDTVARIHLSFGMGAVLRQIADPEDPRRALPMHPDLARAVEADMQRHWARALSIVEERRPAVLALTEALLAQGVLAGPRVRELHDAALPAHLHTRGPDA